MDFESFILCDHSEYGFKIKIYIIKEFPIVRYKLFEFLRIGLLSQKLTKGIKADLAIYALLVYELFVDID